MVRCNRMVMCVAPFVVAVAGCEQGEAEGESAAVQAPAQTPVQAATTPAQTAPVSQPSVQPAAQVATAASQGTSGTPRRIVPPRPAPAEVLSPTIDAGRVSPVDLAHGAFTIRNRLAVPIEIDHIQITCNCTRAKPRADVIPPKGEIVVDMFIDLRGDTGPFEKQAHVHFKGFPDPATMRLIGDFQFAVAAEPARPKVDQQSKTGEIRLTSQDGRPFNILSVNGQAPTFVSKTPPDAAAMTACTVAYDLRGIRIPPALVIITDHPDCPVIPLKLRGPFTGAGERNFVLNLRAIALSQRFVNLGVLEPGVPKEIDMTVFREPAHHNLPVEVYLGRDDITAKVTHLGVEQNATMFPKAQRMHLEVTSTVTEPGQIILTPIYVEFSPPGSFPKTQRVWAAGITAGEHTPSEAPLQASYGRPR